MAIALRRRTHTYKVVLNQIQTLCNCNYVCRRVLEHTRTYIEKDTHQVIECTCPNLRTQRLCAV